MLSLKSDISAINMQQVGVIPNLFVTERKKHLQMCPKKIFVLYLSRNILAFRFSHKYIKSIRYLKKNISALKGQCN
jgi:hypothetical protein